ncbi:MAG TPA: ComEC/Rec2 family competence protein [Patescibacteria group bacterium]|nr:ComEC/Rec2 family competence protein [Patescibacteria group bacterium]
MCRVNRIWCRLRWIAVVLLLAFCTACGNQPVAVAPGSGVTVKILDVGQGDAILIRTPEQVTLIDTGDVPARDKLVSLLKQQGISSIDQVIITHPHSDHLGGMAAVIDNFTVKKVYDSGQPATTALYRNYLNQLQKKNIPFQVVRVGDPDINIGTGVQLKVFGPQKTLMTGSESDLNNNSVVVRLSYGAFSVLLMGDAEKETEAVMLKNDADGLKSTLLKVGHHGSNSSTSLPFLTAVSPEAALICVGANNDYHHPHPSIVKRLEQKKVPVFRTDLNGTITITSDGKTYKIDKER